MPVTLTARISDVADLKLRAIEVKLKQAELPCRRPDAVEAAILAADADTCIIEAQRAERKTA